MLQVNLTAFRGCMVVGTRGQLRRVAVGFDHATDCRIEVSLPSFHLSQKTNSF